MKKVGRETYFSNGNLLISGEYFVLIGAKALATPLKYGQDINVVSFEDTNNAIHWQTNELGKIWFKADFNTNTLEIINTTDNSIALWLQKVLKALLELQPKILHENSSYNITSNISFKTKWGWGSSSSLLLNLANWARVDPFELNKRVSSGSGYDIAASGSPSPIIYQVENNRERIVPIGFNPVFKEKIHFIYLGKKQNTARSIENKIEAVKKNANLVSGISSLAEKMAVEQNIDDFMKYMSEHENILSKSLEIPKIKEKYFMDFEGEIKSLGAWGGDFVMTVSHLPESDVKQYFKNKNLDTIFSFSELVRY